MVVEHSMVDCVSKQMQAFKEGFEQFFPISSLKMFYSSEVSVAYVTPCAQDLNWMYVRRSEAVLDVFWTSDVSSVYSLSPGGRVFE